MKRYGDLEITGSVADLQAVLERIDAGLTNGWCRDTETEREQAHRSLGLGETFLYRCSAQGTRPAALLCLWRTDEEGLKVVNIVPAETGRLSFDQYNAILDEFRTQFVEAASRELPVTISAPSSDVTIEHWVSPETANKLERFSALANKSTGSSHPADEARWYDFLIACHLEESTLDPTSLCRWLQESHGWDEDHAYDLAAEFESARSLLRYYDRHR